MLQTGVVLFIFELLLLVVATSKAFVEKKSIAFCVDVRQFYFENKLSILKSKAQNQFGSKF